MLQLLSKSTGHPRVARFFRRFPSAARAQDEFELVAAASALIRDREKAGLTTASLLPFSFEILPVCFAS